MEIGKIKRVTEISGKICELMNTHDKRWMFMKTFFPGRLSYVNLEGPPERTCFCMVEEIFKNDEQEKLEEILLKHYWIKLNTIL